MQRRQRQIQPTDLKAKAIGVVVRELRDQAGLSQERLSADCGFDRTYAFGNFTWSTSAVYFGPP